MSRPLSGPEPTAAASPRWRRLTLHHVAVPLRQPFEAAHGTESVREVVVVEAEDADGIVGWGECDALSAPTYTHEYTAGAFALLAQVLGPPWLRGLPPPGRHHPMASAALVAAEADVAARRAGCSLAVWLGGATTALARTVVIGRQPTVDRLGAAVESAWRGGAALVKVKVDGPADRDALVAVRAALPAVALAADANGSFAGVAAADLRWLEPLGLRYLEQPYPADDLLATAELACRVAVPIVLDESISSVAAARTALAVGALGSPDRPGRGRGEGARPVVGGGVNVKPARVGGLHAAVALSSWAAGEGLSCFCGGMVELGVGRAAAVAFAAGAACTWPTDLGPTRQYVARDLTEPIELDETGALVVPDGPGLGLAVDEAWLGEVTRRTVTLVA